MTLLKLKKFAWYGSSAAFAAVLALALLVTGPARNAEAATTVGIASAANVNLSTNAATGTNQFTTLGVITLTSNAAGTDITAAGDIVVTPTAGWSFDTSSNPTFGVTGAVTVAAAPSAFTATSMTIDVTVNAGNTDTVTITGLKVKPNTVATATGTLTFATAGASPTLALTAVVDAGNYVNGGSSAGATSTAAKTGGTVVQVTAQGTGVTSATFQTTAGAWASNNAATLFCNDQNTSCDVASGVATVVQAALILPASGTATVTVTPAAGTASTITITTTAAPVLTSINVATAAVAVDAAGTTTGDITFQLRDQSGAAFSTSGTVTISTNLGVIDSGDFTTCSANDGTPTPASSDASCTITNTGANHVVEIFGNGVSGTATVTITATIGGNTVSATKTVTISGVVSTVAMKLQSQNASAGVFVDAATPASTATGTTFRASIDLRDAGGSRVVGQNATLTFSPAGCATSDGVGDANVTATSDAFRGIDPALAAGTTCTVTATANLKTATATFTVGSAVATTSVVTVTAPDIATVKTGTITVDVKGSTGIAVGDNTAVTLVVTAGALVDSTVETKDGVATFTYVSPGTAQSVNATAVLANGVSGSATFVVGAAVTPPPPATGGTFTGTIAPAGLSIVSFTGTNAQLTTAGQAAKVITASATSGGKLFTFVIGAPDFVNVEFVAAFPTHAGTLMIVKTGS